MDSRYKLALLSVAISGLAFSQPVLAEHETCNDIEWKPQILERFAAIDEACHDVVVRDGKKFVHFEVKLIRARANGDVTVEMKMRDGSHVQGTFFAPRDFHVLSHSGKTAFHMNELSRGDILDVYVPQSRVEGATADADSA